MKIWSLNGHLPHQPSKTDTAIVTAGYYGAFVILGMCVAVLGPTLPGLAEQTHSSIKSLSFLFTARSLGYIIGAFIMGRLFDEVKGHPVIVIMLLVTALILALVPIAPLLGILIVLMLCLGISESAVDVGANTLLVWLHRGNVGSTMNGLHFFFGVGAFLTPILIAEVLIRTDGIAWTYWILAILVIPVAIAFLYLPSPTIQKKQEARNPKTEHPFKVFVLVVFFFLWVGIEMGFGGWIYLYAIKAELASKTSAAYLTSAFWGAFTITRLASIPLAAKVKPVIMLLGSLIGSLISIVVILAFPMSLRALIMGSIGAGAFMATVFPTTLAFAERRMTITGKLTGLFFIGGSIGAMTFPWLMGQLLEDNHKYMMQLELGLLVFALFILLWISSVMKPKPGIS